MPSINFKRDNKINRPDKIMAAHAQTYPVLDNETAAISFGQKPRNGGKPATDSAHKTAPSLGYGRGPGPAETNNPAKPNRLAAAYIKERSAETLPKIAPNQPSELTARKTSIFLPACASAMTENAQATAIEAIKIKSPEIYPADTGIMF